MKERAIFATKFGVIATSVGSAVGLGNIWRFPYEAGVHGGGAFLLIYIICVFVIGIPVMCAEFIMGRGTHKNVLGAFRTLTKNTRWYFCSYIGIVASLMILSFYSVVAGWTLEYLYEAVTGILLSSDFVQSTNSFNSAVSSTSRGLLWTILFLGLNYIILLRGIQKGIEKVSNIVMPILFVLLVVFCVNSLFLPGTAEGLEFLFNPDFSKITPSVVLGALGQAFFSLSLGLSALLIYASYFSDEVRLVKSATIVALLDTLVAILAGVIIFPAVFSYGAVPAEGPKLVFEILPTIFAQMPGGNIWAVLFFLLLFFASITSTISMSEISIAFFSEEYKITRKSATKLTTAIALVFGSISALSFGVLSDFKIFGLTFFNLLDYISSNILLPIGGIVFAIFVGWVLDKQIVRNQLTNNGKVKVRTFNIIIFLVKYVAPPVIIVIFLYGLS